jgi:hypothetical protein
MQRALLLAVLACLMGAVAGQQPAASAKPSYSKVVICHVPPDDPDNAHVLVVNLRAVRAHLAHGDYLGECRPPTESPEAPQ